jgi:hypothetical protein
MKNVTIDIKGNNLPCDCSIEWITQQNNESNIHIMDVTGEFSAIHIYVPVSVLSM